MTTVGWMVKIPPMFAHRKALSFYILFLPLLMLVATKGVPAHAGVTDWPEGPFKILFHPNPTASEAQRQEKNDAIFQDLFLPSLVLHRKYINRK